MVKYLVLFGVTILLIAIVIITFASGKFVSMLFGPKNATLEGMNITKECWEWKGHNCEQDGICYIPQKLRENVDACNETIKYTECIKFCEERGVPMDNCYLNSCSMP